MRLNLLLLFLVSTGCALFVERIERPLLNSEEIRRSAPVVQTFCPLERDVKNQFVGNNTQALETYLQILGNKATYDVLDHFALLSLAQMSVRPDQTSGTSRLQVLFNYRGENFYFDFFSEEPEDQYPFFYGIEWVLRKFGRHTRLEDYAAILASSTSQRFRVSSDFAAFLNQNQSAIKEDLELAPYFIRGTEVLKEEESFPKIDYRRILTTYRKAEKGQKVIVNTSLIPFIGDGGTRGNCNYDFNLYDNSIFLIDKVIPVSNLYGFTGPKGSFMASSSQRIERISSLAGQPIFRGLSKVRSSAVCVIEGEPQKIWSISNRSRDPGQHLYHLMRYGLSRTQTPQEVDRLIRHSRHLFLSDPTRLIIESNRSHASQIEDLLKLDLPIYHAEKLGNIWAFSQFKDMRRFIIDDRNQGAFLCK